MGKGGGVDTSGLESSANMMSSLGNQALGLAKEQTDFGKSLYRYGRKFFEQYSRPVYDEFARILGFGGGGGSGGGSAVGHWEYPGGGTGASGTGATNIPSSGDISRALSLAFGGYSNSDQGWKMLEDWGIDTSKLKPGGSTSLADIAPSPYGYDPNDPTSTATSPQFDDWVSRMAGDLRADLLSQQANNRGQPVWVSDTGGTTTGGDRYVSPLESHLFQLPIWAAKQQEAQQRKALRDVTGLGPVSEILGENEIGRATNEMLTTNAFNQVSSMINSMLTGGTGMYQTGIQGYSAATGAGQGFMNMAGSLYGQAAGIQGQLAQLQNAANAQSGSLWGGILGTIGSLGGTIAGGLLGGPLGAGAGATIGSVAGGSINPSQFL